MKKVSIKYFIYLLIVSLVGFSCQKNMTDLNRNPKEATTVSGQMLFSNAQLNFANYMMTPNVNTGIFELISQYWAETTYPQESQYDLGYRSIPLQWWNAWYHDVIKNIDQSEVIMKQEAKDPTLLPAQKVAYKNKLAIAGIFKAYSFYVLLNTYGNIPYTQALQAGINTTPVYDDQKTVYYALIDSINANLIRLDASGSSFDDADLVYGGDVSAWFKLGNSIKLKMGILLADVDNARAKTVIESAAPFVFTSNNDNAILRYTTTPPNVNPIWTNLVQGGRKDFVAANTFVDTMNNRNDPRRAFYYTKVGGAYVGGIYGSGNRYANFSAPSGIVKSADFPAVIMDNAEVEFLLAEGASRGFNVGGTATDHYNNAVTASIIYWGGSATDAVTYLAQSSVAFDPVNWKKSIGVQQWIAYYTRGFDAWTAIRRLDYPRLVAPSSAKTAFPVRYTYPTTEANLNEVNYNAASAAIGGDAVTTKLFWDKF